jgi:hypothetical protein
MVWPNKLTRCQKKQNFSEFAEISVQWFLKKVSKLSNFGVSFLQIFFRKLSNHKKTFFAARFRFKDEWGRLEIRGFIRSYLSILFSTQHSGFMIRVSAALNFRIQHSTFTFGFVWELSAFMTSLTILKMSKYTCFTTPSNITHRSTFKRGERRGALSALLQQTKSTWKLSSFYSERMQIFTCENTVICCAGKETTKKIISDWSANFSYLYLKIFSSNHLFQHFLSLIHLHFSKLYRTHSKNNFTRTCNQKAAERRKALTV